MTLTQNIVNRYCEENNLKIVGWNFFDEEIGDLVVVKEMPVTEEWQGATAIVEENEMGISDVNCFYTARNIKCSYPRLRVTINGKFVNVKR